MQTRKLPKLSARQWWGVGCIYLAGLSWLADMIIPFTHLPNKSVLFFIALAFAEISFFTGVALLGRATYARAKAAVLRQLSGRGRGSGE